MNRNDVYQEVTNKIIEALEQGLNSDFDLPWHGVSQLPENALTKKRYKGVNIPLLWAYQISENYKSGIWATYKQWQECGAQVKKDEKSALIVFLEDD